MNVLCGTGLLSASAQLLEQAGIQPANAYTLSIAQYALGGAAAATSCVLMERIAYRTLCISGLCATVCILFTIGVLAVPSFSTSISGWVTGVMLLLFA